MKREDLKKHYKEEKPGSSLEIKICKILLLLFFLFSFNIYSQIPINNFCGFNTSRIDTGFHQILSCPNENSSESRLLFYSKQKREIAFYNFTRQKKIELQNFLSLRAIPSNISVLNRSRNTFVYTSRKARKVGIFRLVDNKKIFFTSETGFNSYPDNLSVADINNDGKNEVLVSGSAFNGLSILYFKTDKIKEEKIVQNSIYPKAIFADINSDSLYDIVGFNLLDNTLDFFYNQGDSTFYKARSINVTNKVNNLFAIDLNKDSYPDIVFSDDNSIHIIYGDFRSSYSDSVTLNTQYHADKIIFGDFNNDGKTDIAYADFNTGIISIFYAKSSDTFFDELTLIKKEKLEDIASSRLKNERAIFALTSDGEVSSISQVENISNNTKIVLSQNPSNISLFDYHKNWNYCFIDNSSKRLNVVLSDLNSIPKTFYSLPLMQSETRILIRSLSPNEYAFFCYNENEPLIEFYVINFSSKAVNKRIVHASIGINDLNVMVNQNKIEGIYYSYKHAGKFGVTELKNDNNKFQVQKIFEIDGELLSSKIFTDNQKVVYFWVNKADNIKLYKKQLYDPFEEFSLFAKYVNSFKGISNLWTNFLSDGSYDIVSLISGEKNSFFVFHNKNYFINKNLKQSWQPLFSQGFQIAKCINGDRVFGYSLNNNTFFELKTENNSDNVDINQMLDNIKMKEFIVSKYGTENEFLIYLQNTGIINFKKLF